MVRGERTEKTQQLLLACVCARVSECVRASCSCWFRVSTAANRVVQAGQQENLFIPKIKFSCAHYLLLLLFNLYKELKGNQFPLPHSNMSYSYVHLTSA